MNVTNSLGEIIKNSSSLKQWEAEQDKIDAKREELGKKKPPTQEELKKAADLGNTIIDVVDIMDQHSEDIAENVETATALPMALIPLATLVGGTIVSNKFLITPASKELGKIHNEFYKKHDHKKIYDMYKQIKEANIDNTSLTPLDKLMFHGSTSILNEKLTKKLTVPNAIKSELEIIQKEWGNLPIKNIARKARIGLLLPAIAFIGSFIAGNIYSTKLQVGSSKVARYQARDVLKDPKYFVNYTPEQIEEAKQNLEANSNASKKSKKKKLNTDKLKGGLFGGIASVLKDNKKYQEWRKSADAKPEKIERPLTQQELVQAQKDKEIIQRTIRKINNKAEEYSENMEVASDVIMNGTPFLGAGIGILVEKVLDATKILPNTIQSLVNKYGDKEAQKAYTEYINAAKDAPNKKRLFKEFKYKMDLSNVDKELADAAKVSKLSMIIQNIEKKLPVLLSTKWGKNKTFGLIGGIVTGLIGIVIGLKLQKSSARAGRYVAKQELIANPQNFVGYTDEEINNTQASSNKIKKKNGLKEYLLFLPNVMKQYYAYKKYTKNNINKEKELKEELTKLNVTQEQLTNAKNLQRKLFNTFEQVDDKSQDYSESVEVAAQISKPFVAFVGILSILSPAIIVGIQYLRGKISGKTILQKGTSFLGKSTDLLQKKSFKNYLNDVAKKFPSLVQNTEMPDYVKNTSKYSRKTIQEFNLNKSNYKSKIELLKFGVEDISKTKADLDDALTSKIKSIDKMSDEKFKESLLQDSENSPIAKFFDIQSFDKTSYKKLTSDIQKIIKNLPEDELKEIFNKIIKEYEEHPDQFTAMMQNWNLGTLRDILMTPKLKNILIATGTSWLVLNLALIYIIESWIADMQLKAGRLGVKKALESLKDPAYYANSEPASDIKEEDKKLVKTSLLPDKV